MPTTPTILDDILTGTSAADIIDGLAGNDTIRGFNSDDKLIGSQGNDSILGGLGRDTLDGGSGDDYLDPGSRVELNTDDDNKAERANGDGGNDTIFSNSGFNQDFNGGEGDDHLIMRYVADARTSNQRGEAGNDTLEGYVEGNGQLHMFGGDGDDEFILSLRNNVGRQGHHAYGQHGQDTFTFNNWSFNLTIVTGRLDDYDASHEHIYFFNEEIDVTAFTSNNLIHSFSYSGTTYTARLVEYTQQELVGSDDFSSQQFLVLGEIQNGTRIDKVMYALEAARITSIGLNSSGVLAADEEQHFVDHIGGFPGLTSLQSAVYRDPEAFIPHQYFGTVSAAELGDVIYETKDKVEGYDSAHSGTSDRDFIDGYYGRDTIYGLDGDDFLSGGTDNDEVTGGNGNDMVWGGSGNDLLAGGFGSDTIRGGTDRDTIYGGNDNDHIYGGRETDRIFGGLGHDSIRGEDGNDTVYGGNGRDTVRGDDGNDRIYGGNTAYDTTDTHDLLYGNYGNDTIYAATGNDRIYAGSDNDSAFGGRGADTIYGENGNDRLYGGNSENDTLDAADLISGGSGNDTIYGAQGNDRIFAGSNDDTAYGGSGSDTIQGQNGNDRLYGGISFDDGNDIADVIFGGNGHDLVFGAAGNDSIRGDSGNDSLHGGNGTDTVIGGIGADNMHGNRGADLLIGGDGDDTLTGGWGFDQMNGGDGADRFVHDLATNTGSDWIQDYNAAEGDLLRVHGNPSVANFGVNTGHTSGAGSANIEEVFVTYLPTGQILWALVDGAAQSEINISIGSNTFDLL